MTLQCTSARLLVKATVPPGMSVVGVFPHNLMRLHRAKLGPSPDVVLFHAEGRTLPFDGAIHDLGSRYGDRTLTIGGLLAFAVNNRASEPRPIEMRISGIIADGPSTEPFVELGHKTVLGLFAQEVALEPEPADDDGLGLTEDVVGELFDRNIEALIERNPEIAAEIARAAGMSELELLATLSTAEGREALGQKLGRSPDTFFFSKPDVIPGPDERLTGFDRGQAEEP